MPRKRNPIIADFKLRIEWIVEHLDPDPWFVRFIYNTNDIYTIYELAIKANTYQPSRKLTSLTQQTYEPLKIVKPLIHKMWVKALKTGEVSPEFIDWILTLFIDLKKEQLLAVKTEEFYRIGREVEERRKLWMDPCRYFSSERKALHSVAMRFYEDVQTHVLDGEFPIPFPLLIQPGWIREVPLELKEDTESNFLPPLGPFPPSKEPPLLEGLSGAYVTYRGKIGLAKRRAVKLEPQHNGEIFCAQAVLMDNKDFIGFTYRLGHYFDYINTCEILGPELSRWVLNSKEESSLPVQFNLRGTPEDAFDLANRAAYPGVNCLSIFLNYSPPECPRGNWMLLHKRDETQMQAQNSVHVVPAGGHQGFAKSSQKEDTAIWRTVVREFAEELFDMESLHKQPETWSEFLRNTEVKKIINFFFGGAKPAAKINLHGFGLDPITLKPEILCTIIIDWAKVKGLKPKLKFNWELQTADKKVTRHIWVSLSEEGLLPREVLFREATERRHSIGDRELDALPAGAACMLLTAKHYEALVL